MLLSTHVRNFIAIVDAGAITGAADQLNVGKSAVSESLKNLESTLGTRLLIRTTRRLSLTPIGAQFYKRCKEMHDLSQVALEEVSEHLAAPIGPLRITAPHATIGGRIAITEAIAELVQKYPRVTPELIVADERLDFIEHRIDLALTVGALPDSDYMAQRVGTLRDILCVAPGLLVRRGIAHDKISNPHIFDGWPYVAQQWESDEIRHELRSRKTGRRQRFNFNRIAKANSVHAVLSLIKQGTGIGIVPDIYVGESLSKGEVISLLPGFYPNESPIYAVHPFGSLAPLSVRTMIDVMKRYAQNPT